MEEKQIGNTDLESKIATERGQRKVLACAALWLFTGFSAIAMPPAIIGYYDQKKNYLLEHPEEVNHYCRNAEGHARYCAAMMGSAWGCANIMAAMLAGVMVGSYSTCSVKKKQET